MYYIDIYIYLYIYIHIYIYIYIYTHSTYIYIYNTTTNNNNNMGACVAFEYSCTPFYHALRKTAYVTHSNSIDQKLNK